MTVEFTDGLPYLLLWTALGAAVFPGGRRSGALLIALSLGAAVVAGIVAWAGLAVLALFSVACLAAVRPQFPAALRTPAWGAVVFLAVALATHQIP